MFKYQSDTEGVIDAQVIASQAIDSAIDLDQCQMMCCPT
jgi:hypothetical protein